MEIRQITAQFLLFIRKIAKLNLLLIIIILEKIKQKLENTVIN